MIELNQNHFIGRGGTRACYLHPFDSDKCIKIDKRKSGGATEREGRYYEKIALIRPEFPYLHIPRFYGFVETNLGRGGVFDLIRDETDGEISKSFRDYILAGEVTVDHPLWINAYNEYMKELYQQAIIIRDFNPGNICVRKKQDGAYQFITIDGIGHRHAIPLCDYSRWFARYTIKQHVNRKGFGSLSEIFNRIEDKKLKYQSMQTSEIH
ncbi:MAG: hypothetical protein H8M99_03165 [Gloeobacteraceae cyanobacterium ES-bin-144]|nr:hypothetical protein [Verrucomicrobiales bacterium]